MDINNARIKQLLEQVINDAEDAARNIYYAMSHIPKDHPAEANLRLALSSLGVKSPKDVGLSDRVLNKSHD